MRVHLTLKSANVKTGPIPVSTTEKASCPACPFKGNGCYAESGPLALHWSAVSAGLRGTDWADFVATVSGFDEGQFWRHNQAGDLPGAGDSIDAVMLEQLVAANEGRRGFTYTHKPMTEENLEAVTLANLGGFTVNVSANSLDEVDAAMDLGLPAVVVLPIDATANIKTPQGRTVVVCPATQRDDVSCFTCQLCQRADRTVAVGFPAHGVSKKKAQAVFFAKLVAA